LFSLMPTKFHHYILPVLPAAAMLLGIALDDAIAKMAADAGARADDSPAPRFARAIYLGGMLASTLFVALGLSRVFGARALLFDGNELALGSFLGAAWVGA